MTEAATRIIANAITTALRAPWRVHSFDYRGNLAPMTSPFRLSAHSVPAPHVFVEKYVWGATDPDDALRVPAFVWLLTEHRMLAALATFSLTQQGEWRAFLNTNPRLPPLPFRRWPNRHGTVTMRRTLYASTAVAEIATAFAKATTITHISDLVYRDSFPVELWGSSQGVTDLTPKILNV